MKLHTAMMELGWKITLISTLVRAVSEEKVEKWILFILFNLIIKEKVKNGSVLVECKFTETFLTYILIMGLQTVQNLHWI